MLRATFLISILAVCVLGGVNIAQARDISTVQSALQMLGYDPGPIDGAWGGKTRTALESFYSDMQLPYDGRRADNRDFKALAEALRRKSSSSNDTRTPAEFNFRANFPKIGSYEVPNEFAFTEGTNSPRFSDHAYSIPFMFISDFNADGCDDVLTNFADSLAPSRILFGASDLSARFPLESQVLSDFPEVRTIRNIARRDIDGDGNLDFAAFTAPHDWKMNQLGSKWDDTEPDVVSLSGGQIIVLPRETYAHGGLIGDVNGDGRPDVFPIEERPQRPRIAYLSGDDGRVGMSNIEVTQLRDAVIFAAASDDLNGDGIDDFVFLTSRDYRRERFVPPKRASEQGTFVVALGEAGSSINQLEFTSYGSHWMSELDWIVYKLQQSADAEYDQGDLWEYAAPSNVDLLDIDGDGDLDVIVGYFASANSSWKTSGFQIFENEGGQFIDATEEMAPWQPGNRDTVQVTDHMLGAQTVDLDVDGDDDLVLSIHSPDSQGRAGVSASLYINDEGVFRPAKVGAFDTYRQQRSLRAGDVDCDGRTDLIGLGAATESAQRITIFFGATSE